MSQREGEGEDVGGGEETNRGGRKREGDRRETEQDKKCACMHTCNDFRFP